MKNEKRELIEGIELPNQERIRTLGEKENYKYLWILKSDTIKQAEMKEKITKEYFKRTRNQTLQQKSHQSDKQLGCPPW